MSVPIKSTEEAAFVIKHQQLEAVKRAATFLQGLYPEPSQLATAAGGVGTGFLDGVRWLSETLFHALERDGLLSNDGPALETLHLIEAGVKALDNYAIDAAHLTGKIQ